MPTSNLPTTLQLSGVLVLDVQAVTVVELSDDRVVIGLGSSGGNLTITGGLGDVYALVIEADRQLARIARPGT